jgi:hypothetical protein
MAALLSFSKERVLKSGEVRGGEPLAKRKAYLDRKIGELLTGIVVQDNYVSTEMMDGIEREASGRAAYELEEDVMVEEVGFGMHETIARFGASPDGLIGLSGGLELKCPKPSTHQRWIRSQVIPPDHIDQIDSCIAVFEREWWDFSTFCPLVPKEMQLVTIRRFRDDKRIAEIEWNVSEFNELADQAIEELRSICGPFELPAAVSVIQRDTDDFGDLGITDSDLAFLD